MGGLIVLTGTLIPTLLWAKLSNLYVLLAMVVMLWMGFIGFTDDYLKLKQRQMGKKNTGLIEGYKLLGQITIGFALGWYIWKYPLSTLPGASTTLPFYKYILIEPTFAWLYVLFVTFVLTGTSNAVNITDGLDGLAAGLTAIAVLTLALF